MYVWWTNIDNEMEHLVKVCSHCQVGQNVPPVTLLHPRIWSSEPWRQIHVDSARPFCGCTSLVVMDSYSQWSKIIQMKTTTAAATILAISWQQQPAMMCRTHSQYPFIRAGKISLPTTITSPFHYTCHSAYPCSHLHSGINVILRQKYWIPSALNGLRPFFASV